MAASRSARRGVPRAIALALVALLLAVGAACERRAQEAPEAGAPAARLLVTADHGEEVLLERPVPPGQSVMRALRGATDVRTEYGGGFVAEMLGRASDLGAQRDWFLWVNGILSPVGARAVDLGDGDIAWWDHRHWGALTDPWAVAGSWPAPFTAPAPEVRADAPLDAALDAAGARLVDDDDAPWRVRVGASADIAERDPAWARAVRDPAGAGLTAWPRGDGFVALDAASGEATPVPGGAALIAAVPTAAIPERGVLLVVAGRDDAAAQAAARALADDPGIVRGAYALVLDAEGRPLRAGGRPPA